jgi:hypothetical protein
MRPFLLYVALLFLLASCQKEISAELGGGTGDSLLAKIVTTDSGVPDSVVYTYNASRKLAAQTQSGAISWFLSSADLAVTRASAGTISSYTTSDGTGTYSYTVGAGNSKYTYKKVTVDISPGVPATDSTVFQYDASGRINLSQNYILAPGAGIPAYFQYGKSDFSYDANGNLSKIILYSIDTASLMIVKTGQFDFTYDTKTSPLNLNAEAIVLDQFNFCGVNNPTKITYTDVADPSLNEMTTFAYTYNAAGKPLISTATFQSTGNIVTNAYTYK